MAEHFSNPNKIKKYFEVVKQEFDNIIFQEASDSRDKVEEIKKNGNINLLENAHRLIEHIIYQDKSKLEDFARQEGEIWAKNDIDLSFKIEWVQAIRRTIWKLVQDYETNKMEPIDRKLNFYFLEKIINRQIDLFFNAFFIRFSEEKEKQIQLQKERVEELSVPLIPMNTYTYILPMIGNIDESDAHKILKKVLHKIAENQTRILIIDLTSVPRMGEKVIEQLTKMIDSVKMMGCKIVMTGIGPELAKNIVSMGVDFKKKVHFSTTLEQALEICLKEK